MKSHSYQLLLTVPVVILGLMAYPSIEPTPISQQARTNRKRMDSSIISLGSENLEQHLEIINFTKPHEQRVENLAIHNNNNNPVTTTIQQCLNNHQNLKSIEEEYDLTGIKIAHNSRYKYYFPQIFIKEKYSIVSRSYDINQGLKPLNISNILLKQSKENSQGLTSLEQEINTRVNQYRQSKNLPPLQMNAEISNVAREHSKNMASKKVAFSHDGFQNRAESISRLKNVSYGSVGENLAYLKGYPNLADVAVQKWINSPGHRKNIEADFTLTGVGIAKNSDEEYYFTQLFLLQ